MRALVRDSYGGPEVLALATVADPAPGEGEVLVRVRAGSVNDYDYHLLTGQPFVNRMTAPRRPRHRILGSDIAGEVVALGPGAGRFVVGAQVFGDLSTCGFGAYAELAAVPESALAPVPSSLSLEQAGVVPQAGGLAVTALRRRRARLAGERVLVNGAGGGVGTFAVQMAKAAGAQVTAVDAAHKLDVLRALGADRVVDYAREDIARDGSTYDLIVDIVATRSVADYRRMLAPGGECGLLGGDVGRIVRLMATGPLISAFGGKRITVPIWRPNDPDDVAHLVSLVDDGSVVPVVDRVVDLADVPDAFAEFAAQRHRGKIAVRL